MTLGVGVGLGVGEGVEVLVGVYVRVPVGIGVDVGGITRTSKRFWYLSVAVGDGHPSQEKYPLTSTCIVAGSLIGDGTRKFRDTLSRWPGISDLGGGVSPYSQSVAQQKKTPHPTSDPTTAVCPFVNLYSTGRLPVLRTWIWNREQPFPSRQASSVPLIDVILRFWENAASYTAVGVDVGDAVGDGDAVDVVVGVTAVTVTVCASSRTVLSGMMMRNT